MTSEILRGIIFGIAIIALIAQFAYDLVKSREQKIDNDNFKTTLQRIEGGIHQLVSEGKITKEDADRVLSVKLEATLHPREI